MRLITVYSPPTFLKSVIIISTSVYFSDDGIMDGENESAIRFSESLNNNHALNKIDYTDGNWEIMKEHKTKEGALAYHINVATKLCRGYEGHYDYYLDLWYKYGEKKK